MTVQSFRKKPVVIRAVQWTGGNTDEVAAFLGDDFAGVRGGVLLIRTLENPDNPFEAPPGWQVLEGVAGEHYACESGIFERTYDPTSAGMLTVSGVCTCSRCERGGREIYRMVGRCNNCQAGPILMLFTVGHEKRPLRCPSCGVERLHASRPARDDEVPAAEGEAVGA